METAERHGTPNIGKIREARAMIIKPKRGGAREGSGRKPTGRTVTTSSINLPPAMWAKLDALRGNSTRSAWIAAKIESKNPDLTQ